MGEPARCMSHTSTECGGHEHPKKIAGTEQEVAAAACTSYCSPSNLRIRCYRWEQPKPTQVGAHGRAGLEVPGAGARLLVGLVLWQAEK